MFGQHVDVSSYNIFIMIYDLNGSVNVEFHLHLLKLHEHMMSLTKRSDTPIEMYQITIFQSIFKFQMKINITNIFYINYEDE